MEAAGDAGPVFLWFFLSCAEMVPLLPTQPLYLAAGLLFGTPEGILPAWGGTLTAAVLAFWAGRVPPVWDKWDKSLLSVPRGQPATLFQPARGMTAQHMICSMNV